MDDFFSSPNSREVIIAKYTDKSRYKPEYIYGDVYVDEDRISLSNKNTREKEIFERELAAAKRFQNILIARYSFCLKVMKMVMQYM